jgi:hypothetical protein
MVQAVVVVVDGAAQAAGVSWFINLFRSFIMKSSSLLLALVTTLAMGASAYAAGPARSGAAAGTGTHAGSATAGNAGTGAATATKTHAQVHTPGTGLADPSLRVGPGGPGGAAAGTPRGIHTPGTGLTGTTVAQ